MSDMPKGLKCASTIRWGLFAAALLLTVVTGFLVWVETVDGMSPAPRAFVWGIAHVLWMGGIAVSCAVLVIRRLSKKIDRWGNRLLRAYAMQRAGALFDLMEETNVTPMHGRK